MEEESVNSPVSGRAQPSIPDDSFLDGVTSRLEPRLAELAIKSASDATMERITALESQVSKLDGIFSELLVKIDEFESVQISNAGVRRLIADSRSTVNKFDSDKAAVGNAVEHTTAEMPEWLDGQESPKHTVSHPLGWMPVNCICAMPFTIRGNEFTPE